MHAHRRADGAEPPKPGHTAYPPEWELSWRAKRQDATTGSHPETAGARTPHPASPFRVHPPGLGAETPSLPPVPEGPSR